MSTQVIDTDAPSYADQVAYAEQNKEGFSRFVSKRNEKIRIASQHQSFEQSLSVKRDFVANLTQQLDFVAGVDVPKSLLINLKNHAAGGANVGVLAGEFAGTIVLKQHGAELLKLAQAELSALEKEFERFKAENRTVLAELNLV